MKYPAFHATLACHPATPCKVLSAVEASLARTPRGALSVRYRLHGHTRKLVIPAPQPPEPTDGLWQHTCCELFAAAGDEPAYREFNFSPSGQWASYAFDAYRQRAPQPLWLSAPRSRLHESDSLVELCVEIPAQALPPAAPGEVLHLGLSVVAEADDGSLSYWALQHPSPRPDFHHRDAFRLELPA